MIVACQWKRSSPTGPAEHCAGGSRFRSSSSFLILLRAIFEAGKGTTRWESCRGLLLLSAGCRSICKYDDLSELLIAILKLEMRRPNRDG